MFIKIVDKPILLFVNIFQKRKSRNTIFFTTMM